MPPQDFAICPCCGTQFDVDDFERTFRELRDDWVLGGAEWHSRVLAPPTNWDPYEQMRLSDMEFTAVLTEDPDETELPAPDWMTHRVASDDAITVRVLAPERVH